MKKSTKKIKKSENIVKCLILCMGCNDPYYMNQWKDIKETWAKHILDGEYPDIDIIMYTSSGTNEYAYDKNEHILYVPANDSLSGTFDKTVKAIQALNIFNINYDCLLRTNCSTIINLKLLDAFIHSDLYKPYKIYTSEIVFGGIKAAPFHESFVYRGNFLLISRFYANLINQTSLDMLKQVNDYNRIIHKDMFLYDDITICGIFNAFLLCNGIDQLDVYQRMPIQYLDKIYKGEESLYANTIAFFNKSFGDTRNLSEYYQESKMRLINFYTNFYNILTNGIENLKVDFDEGHYVEKHVPISNTSAQIEIISYDEIKKGVKIF